MDKAAIKQIKLASAASTARHNDRDNQRKLQFAPVPIAIAAAAAAVAATNNGTNADSSPAAAPFVAVAAAAGRDGGRRSPRLRGSVPAAAVPGPEDGGGEDEMDTDLRRMALRSGQISEMAWATKTMIHAGKMSAIWGVRRWT